MKGPFMNRDDKDYAIEFGEYLATSADEFLQSCNALEASRMLSDFGAQTVAEQGHNDAWRHLTDAVYEFRKRAARAGHAPSAIKFNR